MSAFRQGDAVVTFNGEPIVGAQLVPWAPTTPAERMGWALDDLTNAFADLTLTLKLTHPQWATLSDVLLRQHRQGGALLARHRRRRHL